MTDNENGCVTVVHSCPVWLPLTQAWMYHQIRYLPPQIECHIVCEKTANIEQFGWPSLHSLERCARWRRFLDLALKRARIRRYPGLLPRVAHRYRARVLHSHFGNVAWANIGAARTAGLAHVATFYGFDVGMLPKSRPVWRRRYRDLFRQVDRVLCEGTHMLGRIAELGCPLEKLRVHHLGVPLDQIPFRPRAWHPAAPLRVLIAASFQEKKGITYALHALARLKRDVLLQVTLIGDANDEPRSQEEKRRILSVIADSSLRSDVRMLGYQSYAALFREAYEHHVFLAPSVTASDGDTEGGAPVTLIEMAASGMPVISSRHCDIPEIVQGGVTGFLVPERDADAIYSALRQLIASPEAWATMATAARRHIEREFDASRQGERLAEIYRELAGL